jgi:hypothetical protein
VTKSDFKSIYDEPHERRVIIFRRDGGSFGFEDQHYCDEQCWIPTGRYSESFCDSAEGAENEARSRVRWLQ